MLLFLPMFLLSFTHTEDLRRVWYQRKTIYNEVLAIPVVAMFIVYNTLKKIRKLENDI